MSDLKLLHNNLFLFFRGYVRAYDSHSLKEIFDVNTLDLIKVSQSFGFNAPPFVDLPVSQKPAIKAREKYTGAGYQKKKGNKNFNFKPKKHVNNQ